MHLNAEFVEELELLNMFNPESTQEGLKVHHLADPTRVASAKRLYGKKMITLIDGGYLTPLGQEAVEHTQALIRMLRSRSS